MASATDVITYIGVPLAVLGVLPLIFNLFRSLIILHRLRTTVPAGCKRFFQFTIDPVGGTVACSFDSVTVRLVSSIEQELVLAGARPIRSHAAFGPRAVSSVEEKGLAATWMGFLPAQSLPLSQRTPDYPRRCVIDYSLQTGLFPMNCEWRDFVFVALALGVPGEAEEMLALRQLTASQMASRDIILRDANGHPVIKMGCEGSALRARLVGRDMTLSLRRALAWDLIMAYPHVDGVEIIPLLRSEDNFIGIGRELAEAPSEIESALTWTIYAETVLHLPNAKEREILPASQRWLKVRADARNELRAVADMKPLLSDIFPLDTALVEDIMSLVDQRHKPNDIRDIWPHMQKVEAFRHLEAQFHPSPQMRSRKDIVLTDVGSTYGILARLLLVTSALRAEKEVGWMTILDRKGMEQVVTPPNPLTALLAEGRGNGAEKEFVPVPQIVWA